MFATKAVLTMVMMAAGGATAGSIAYMQAHPTPFGNPRPAVALPAAPAPLRPMAPPSVAPPEEERVVTIAEVSIVASVPRKAKVARAAIARPAAEPEATTPLPCSSWGALDTGPEGRHVRMLCTPGTR